MNPDRQGALPANILAFARALRSQGLPVSPDLVIDFTNALLDISIRRRSDVYYTGRCLFVHRREDLVTYDRAFAAFWRAGWESRQVLDMQSTVEDRVRRPRRAAASAESAYDLVPSQTGVDSESVGAQPRPALSYSAQERLAHKDFADLTAAETMAVNGMIQAFRKPLALRRSRRLTRGRGGRIDVRGTLRASLRHGGEWLEWAELEWKVKPRSLVVLADVSGSMAAYVRPLMLFVYALSRGYRARVEAFVFGTRLTRITRQLHLGKAEAALEAMARQAPDWSGGTRMGQALEDFNRRWARRVAVGGPVVLLLTDGWDRGAPEQLAQAAARLRRQAHHLIWLNPLLGVPGYQPSTRGSATLMMYADEHRPAHNLAALEALVGRLEDLGIAGAPKPMKHPVRIPSSGGRF